MEYEINTGGKPSLIKIYLEVQAPQRLSIMGYDPNPKHPNSVYFVRSKPVNGKEHLNKNNPIEIPMPITPDVLNLKIKQENGAYGSYINVTHVEVTDMPSRTVTFEPDVLEYYNFIKVVCQEAGYMEPGFYVSKDENFLLWAKKHLDGDGTPARVNRRTGLTKLNLSKIVDYTIFMRIFICLHELIHFKLQTTNETTCDLGAARIFLGMGFPKSEANYAMTKIFDNSPEALKRVGVLNDYIKNHDVKRTNAPATVKR